MMMTGQCRDIHAAEFCQIVLRRNSMFGIGKSAKQKNKPTVTFDPKQQKAVMRCSICTGEQVAGFQDIHTGKFEEVMLIRGEADLQHFREQYGVEEITKIY